MRATRVAALRVARSQFYGGDGIGVNLVDCQQASVVNCYLADFAPSAVRGAMAAVAVANVTSAALVVNSTVAAASSATTTIANTFAVRSARGLWLPPAAQGKVVVYHALFGACGVGVDAAVPQFAVAGGASLLLANSIVDVHAGALAPLAAATADAMRTMLTTQRGTQFVTTVRVGASSPPPPRRRARSLTPAPQALDSSLSAPSNVFRGVGDHNSALVKSPEEGVFGLSFVCLLFSLAWPQGSTDSSPPPSSGGAVAGLCLPNEAAALGGVRRALSMVADVAPLALDAVTAQAVLSDYAAVPRTCGRRARELLSRAESLTRVASRRAAARQSRPARSTAPPRSCRRRAARACRAPRRCV